MKQLIKENPRNKQRIAALQSSTHDLWARVFGSSLEDRFMYAVADCFEPFPFPTSSKDVAIVGQRYHGHRAKMMLTTDLGLTKTFNRFHDTNDKASDIVELRRLHDEMDRAVLQAYGWNDLARKARPEFLTEQTEDDPKYQRRRFWTADFRAEVLSRLLALNADRYAVEQAAGAKKKAPRSKPKDSKQHELL
jgi:hypothetical protein